MVTVGIEISAIIRQLHRYIGNRRRCKGHFGRPNVTGAEARVLTERECVWMLQSTYVGVTVFRCSKSVNLGLLLTATS